MSAEDRRALRQAEALPILARMKARFEEVRPTLRPTSKLAEAIDYVLNRWDAFVRYTSDGRIPIDNNVIERLLRPVAIGRKNFLFFGSEKGGQTAATLYTLVQSARRNCVDVWPYLTDVLRRIAAIAPGDTAALEALLPDRWVAAHPEHRLEQREEESREAQARRRRKRAARRPRRHPVDDGDSEFTPVMLRAGGWPWPRPMRPAGVGNLISDGFPTT